MGDTRLERVTPFVREVVKSKKQRKTRQEPTASDSRCTPGCTEHEDTLADDVRTVVDARDRLWDASTGRCAQKFEGHEKKNELGSQGVHDVCFSPDGRLALSG